MTTIDPDSRNAPDKFDVMTADEFNLWCALNGKPYRLARHVWPDGRAEWDVEVDPGKAEGMVCYGTGREDEAVAAAAAFAFIAGVEWAEASIRARLEDEILADEDDETAIGDDTTIDTEADIAPSPTTREAEETIQRDDVHDEERVSPGSLGRA